MHQTKGKKKIPVIYLSDLAEIDFEGFNTELSNRKSLREVLAWAKGKPGEAVHPHVVAEVITQDEFTHDIIVPYRGLFLVYDTT